MHHKIYDSICDVIGGTPVIRLKRIPQNNWAEMLVKLELFNPGGSVKDRIGLSMIEAAEREGRLKPGGTIIEATSGNTGIGLAMVGAAKGYKVVLTMPDDVSIERVALLRAYGARVILTHRLEFMQGAIKKAEEILAEHRETTAQEILDVVGTELDALVVGVGTGGTATGVGEVVKQRIQQMKLIAIEPSDSPVLSGGKPGWHKIQGIGAGFIPEVLNRRVIDRVVTVTNEEAAAAAHRLAEQEGMLCGISSGAVLHASCIVAQELGRGKRLLAILPDTGERYVSTWFS
ncbi:MAG: cysteine synthase A [Acidobacteria bacterium]|nr:MAG: cysteine synthase A [Acidobacteriota bacterium]